MAWLRFREHEIIITTPHFRQMKMEGGQSSGKDSSTDWQWTSPAVSTRANWFCLWRDTSKLAVSANISLLSLSLSLSLPLSFYIILFRQHSASIHATRAEITGVHALYSQQSGTGTEPIMLLFSSLHTTHARTLPLFL